MTIYNTLLLLRSKSQTFRVYWEKMMYERNMTLSLVTNASAVTNNLAVQFDPLTKKALTVAIIHEGYINVIPIHHVDLRARYIPCVECGSRPRHVSTTVTQVLWCNLGKQQVFIVASSLGVQIFSHDGRVCKFSHPCSDTPDAGGNYAHGLALLGTDRLCVGNSTGKVRIFHALDKSDEIELIESKQCHEKAITDLTGSEIDNLLVTADDSGAVCMWQLKEELQLICDFPTFGYPCSSVKIWKDYILCAYGSGHIRVFNIVTKSLVSEITGHARWITAIDVAPESGLILSVSEDSFAKVWKISEEDGKVLLKFSTKKQDWLLVGGRFLTPRGDIFCVTSYDSCDVMCFAA